MPLPYDEAGDGAPLVLLHAGIADRTMWSEQLEPLADAGYRAVALDIPGFGEASVPPGPDAPWTDVLQTMAELGIDRAALVGNSYGGAVALRMAVVAPVAASALALISAPAPGFDPSPELGQAWRSLALGTFTWRAALAAHRSLAEACEAALATDPDFDLATALQALFAADLVVNVTVSLKEKESN